MRIEAVENTRRCGLKPIFCVNEGKKPGERGFIPCGSGFSRDYSTAGRNNIAAENRSHNIMSNL